MTNFKTALPIAMIAAASIAGTAFADTNASRGASNDTGAEVMGNDNQAEASSSLYDADGNRFLINWDAAGNATSDDLNRSRGAGNTTGGEAMGDDNQREVFYDEDKNEVVVVWGENGLLSFEATDGYYTEDNLNRSRGAGNATGGEVMGNDNQAEND